LAQAPTPLAFFLGVLLWILFPSLVIIAAMARSSLLSCVALACILSLLALNLWQLNFIGAPRCGALRGRVALAAGAETVSSAETGTSPGETETGSSDSVKRSVVAVGSDMPAITLPDQDGKLVSISSFKSEEGLFGIFGGSAGKPVVLFFFAGSASPSCTKEAQAFRDRYAAFKAKGCEVFGVSKDSVEFQKGWKETEELPFSLLSDEGGKVREMLAIPNDFFFLEGRQTYVIGTDGKVKMIYNDQFGPETHIEEALAAL